MLFSNIQQEFILSTNSRVLATFSKEINVIPVSTLFIENNKIILCNYFMKKTLNNILENPEISFSCWSGTQGIQVKGRAEYQNSGNFFKKINEQALNIHPKVILQGIIIIHPKKIYDISIQG